MKRNGTLVLGWGNLSRGDDALGPMLVERLATLNLAGVDFMTEYQLQIEHALELRQRERVLFIDASTTTSEPFEIIKVTTCRDKSFTSHALSAGALLEVYRQLEPEPAPPCWMLALRAASFELGEAPSQSALQALDQAFRWAQAWLLGAPSGT